MKVIVGPPKDGYTHGKRYEDLSQLDDNECEVLELPNCDNLFNNIQDLDLAISKMRHGATLIITGISCYIKALSLVNGSLSPEQWRSNTGKFTCQEISEYLASKGLRIEKKRTNGENFVVEAVRD